MYHALDCKSAITEIMGRLAERPRDPKDAQIAALTAEVLALKAKISVLESERKPGG